MAASTLSRKQGVNRPHVRWYRAHDKGQWVYFNVFFEEPDTFGPALWPWRWEYGSHLVGRLETATGWAVTVVALEGAGGSAMSGLGPEHATGLRGPHVTRARTPVAYVGRLADDVIGVACLGSARRPLRKFLREALKNRSGASDAPHDLVIRQPTISTDDHGSWVRHKAHGWVGRVGYRLRETGDYAVVWEQGDTQKKPPSGNRALHLTEELELLTDLEPEPWYDKMKATVPSIAELFTQAGITPGGAVRWHETVPLDSPGVYVIALTDDADATTGALPAAPLGDGALGTLLDRCQQLKVEGQRPTLDELRARIAAFWVLDQSVLYIGKAGTSVRQRVGQYYRTPLGARSPHAGGWFLKLLANLNELFVHYAATDTPEETERALVEAFMASVSPEARKRLPNPDLPLPFANLQVPSGGRKPHGITGATGCGASAAKAAPREPDEPGSTPPERPGGPTSSQRGSKVTLHEEILAILIANGDEWMTLEEVSKQVQRRGNYKKRDGSSSVDEFQVHGRTKNYPHLFERDGRRVRRRR